MQFSKKELTAIMKVAYEMAEIDGRMDDVELEVIYSQMKRFGLEHDELITLSEYSILSLPPHSAMEIIAEMSHIQKEYVQALLIIVMASDGVIHENEMIMLRMITMLCGLPPISMKDINNTLSAFQNRTT